MAIVIKEFRDKNNFAKVYKVGEEVEFDEVRLAKLAELGLVESKNIIVTEIDLTKQWMQVVADVKTFTDVEKLSVALEIENKSDKPRDKNRRE